MMLKEVHLEDTVFYDYENDRTFYISYLVFNPGGKKAFYMRQLEMIAKTISINS